MIDNKEDIWLAGLPSKKHREAVCKAAIAALGTGQGAINGGKRTLDSGKLSGVFDVIEGVSLIAYSHAIISGANPTVAYNLAKLECTNRARYYRERLPAKLEFAIPDVPPPVKKAIDFHHEAVKLAASTGKYKSEQSGWEANLT